MKFGDTFSNLIKIKCMKLYSDLFRFEVFIVQCPGGSFCQTQCRKVSTLWSGPLCYPATQPPL